MVGEGLVESDDFHFSASPLKEARWSYLGRDLKEISQSVASKPSTRTT